MGPLKRGLFEVGTAIPGMFTHNSTSAPFWVIGQKTENSNQSKHLGVPNCNLETNPVLFRGRGDTGGVCASSFRKGYRFFRKFLAAHIFPVKSTKQGLPCCCPWKLWQGEKLLTSKLQACWPLSTPSRTPQDKD